MGCDHSDDSPLRDDSLRDEPLFAYGSYRQKPIRCEQFPFADWQLRQLHRLSHHGYSFGYAHQEIWL